MNPRQTRTGITPRLTAGCVLGILLAASPGCVGEDLELDPEERPENLDQSRRSIAHADAGSGDVGDPYGDGDSYADAGTSPGNASCGAEPGKPYADAGVPPAPYVDAGAPGADAGEPRSCFGQLIGDGNTCISELDLKLQGEALCSGKGYTIDALKLGEGDCAGGSTEGWVSCCEPPPPPREPDGCTGGVIGDGATCMDLTTLKLKASGACEAIGASLVGLAGSADQSCPSGALWAKYECCKTGAAPTPSDPGKGPWLK
jgi:hypothetical protein